MQNINNTRISYFLSGNAPDIYPADTLFGLLFHDTDVLELPKRYPYKGEWGHPISTHLSEHENYPIPKSLDLVWLSVVERKIYSLETNLPCNQILELLTNKKETCDKLPTIKYVIIGMAPYGRVAIWIHEPRKSFLLTWLYAETVCINASVINSYFHSVDIDTLCNSYINNDPRIKDNLEKTGLPPRNLFDKYMQQFTYRYLQVFEKWNKDKENWLKYKEGEVAPELDYIEEALYDGTHDKLHDGGLMRYHQAGKPKKLRVQWHIKKLEYTAYFWFEDERIREVFDKFYGAHPDTKTDFIIRIDAEKRKYELALYRYGLKEPQIIPEDVYQLLVFKNKFEDYRSENYNQERGAWIW